MSKGKDMHFDVPTCEIKVDTLPIQSMSIEYEKKSNKLLTYMWLATIGINLLTSFAINPVLSNILGNPTPYTIVFILVGLLSAVIATIFAYIPYKISIHAIKKIKEIYKN